MKSDLFKESSRVKINPYEAMFSYGSKSQEDQYCHFEHDGVMCAKGLPDTVYIYSKTNFNKPLCFHHQKNVRKEKV